ncbi:sensor histidine kinase [Streptococcus suis]|uniref:sensor histidine kinase n=1 Tax=Streptococcus suis TaxID=1307 RepID=UPI0038BB77E2
MIHFQAIQFVSWLIKLFIFQTVSQYRFKYHNLLLIPMIIALVDYFYYEAIFWGEIFFLPIIAIFIKYNNNWNWTQYFFYSFFTLSLDDILMRISTIYFQFIFRVSYEEIIQHAWSGWIPMVLIPIFYLAFFSVSKLDIEAIHDSARINNLYKIIVKFNISLILYSFLNYTLSSLSALEYYGIFENPFNDIYYQRLILFCYFPIFLGFLFYINYIVKTEQNNKIQKIKDTQISAMKTYSNHVEALYKEIRSFRHDYSNLLISLNESINSKDISSVKAIYDTVLATTSNKFKHSKYDIANLSNLQNPAMKSILSAKLIEAQNYGIELNVEIEESISEPNSIELVEFLQMLSIFLDNAIEAALESSIPKLSFVYFEEHSHKIIVIENSIKNDSIDTKKIFQEGYSTKGTDRGLGLSNVKEILQRNPNIVLKTDSQSYLFKQELIILEKK